MVSHGRAPTGQTHHEAGDVTSADFSSEGTDTTQTSCRQNDSTPTEVVFFIDELLKQHRPGCTGLQLKFPAYPADARLCLASHIRHYVKVTARIRGMERYLLVTHKRPHHRVTVQTISRWLRVVLGKSGIDTNVFKSHSTRAASTSAARVMEVPMDQILATAGWANEAVFQRFYNKPVAAPLQFAEAVLNAGQERGDVPA